MNDKDLEQINKAIQVQIATYHYDLLRKKGYVKNWVQSAWNEYSTLTERSDSHSTTPSMWSEEKTQIYNKRVEAAVLNAQARMLELFGFEIGPDEWKNDVRMEELAARLLYLEAVKCEVAPTK